MKEKFFRRGFMDKILALLLRAKTYNRFPSGQIGFSPDETTLRRFPSGQNHDPPDERPLRLARQNHFGSQCDTEGVYRYLPAKVERV